MNAVQKFALVPPELVQTPSANHLNELDTVMKQILATDLPADLKVLLYQDKLTKFLSTKESGRRPVKVPIIKQAAQAPEPTLAPEPAAVEVQNSIVDQEYHNIMREMPKSRRATAELLMDFLKKNEDKIAWGQNLELLDQGDAVVGSNIRNLVHYISRDITLAPDGADEFLDQLRTNEVPAAALWNKRVKRNTESPFQTPSSKTPRHSRTFTRSNQSGTGWISLYK